MMPLRRAPSVLHREVTAFNYSTTKPVSWDRTGASVLTLFDEISLRSGQRTAQEEVKWAYPTDQIPLRPPNSPEAWEAKMSNTTQRLLVWSHVASGQVAGRERVASLWLPECGSIEKCEQYNKTQHKTCCFCALLFSSTPGGSESACLQVVQHVQHASSVCVCLWMCAFYGRVFHLQGYCCICQDHRNFNWKDKSYTIIRTSKYKYHCPSF